MSRRRTRRTRQNNNIENHEEEDTEYARADIEDAMIMMEEGEEVEEEEARIGTVNEDEVSFERVIQDLRKACVSDKSQNNYMCSMTNMINWFAVHEGDDQNSGFDLLTETWRLELSVIDDEKERKKRIRDKLNEADPNDPPIDFDTFKASKYNYYEYCLFCYR